MTMTANGTCPTECVETFHPGIEHDEMDTNQRLARIENILANLDANNAAVASVAENVTQMTYLLGIIQEEAGPVIQSLQSNPMVKMMLGGK